MANFGVNIVKIRALEAIPGADVIELAVVGDYRSVVKKGQHQVGELVAYIPEAAIVPAWLLKSMQLDGKLAGTDKNRVKAIKLRGCLSQGIVLGLGRYHLGMSFVEPAPEPQYFATRPKMGADLAYPAMSEEQDVDEGDDVAEFLGITKWEPIVPASMSGEVYAAGQHLTVPYDIENYKKFPDVLKDGEEVVFTEKLHGTFCGVGILPPEFEDPKHFKSKFVVFSKGLGAQGLCFKEVDANASNVYIRTLTERGVFDRLVAIREAMLEENGEFPYPLFLLGEVFGGSIQDAGWYSNTVDFRVFEVVAGFRGNQYYFSIDAKQTLCKHLGLDTVPYLYRGPFSKEVMLQYTSGKETVSGQEKNMREGIVVTPVEERRDDELGRVILKSVSEEYLLRKNGTEFS